MRIKNKKILVTGGAGFIGSHTADELINRGAKVIVVDNLVTGRRKNINESSKFYEMNISDLKIEDVFKKEKPEIVYHFAFNVLVPKSLENPLYDMDSIAGAVNVFKNACKYGTKKIILASSGFLYGNTKNLPAKETEPIDYVSPYVVAKSAAENYLRFFNKVYGIGFVILRYAAVYGPRQVTGAMADYIRKLKAGKQAEIWGDGTKTRDYVYISDVVNANLSVLSIPQDYPNPVFNIGTGKETTLNELYEKIANLLHQKSDPTYLPDRPGEQLKYSLDCSKIRNVLGWKPKVSLEEGLRLRIGDVDV